MFRKILQDLGTDKDYPTRAILIDLYTRIYEGEIYDHLEYPFCIEYDMQGNYIQLRDRRPSVRYNICKLVVDDSVSLTFGSEHFPDILCKDKIVKKFVDDLIKQTKMNAVMIEAATYGSVGSIAVLMRILNYKIFWSVLRTQYLTPTFQPNDPEELLSIQEKYKVRGCDLRAIGYTQIEDDDQRMYWFQRVWDAQREIWYNPWLVTDKKKKPTEDKKRTIPHNLGFVPMVFIKNLFKPNSVDGVCTFKDGIDTQMEMEYQLSQAGRGLKYSSDPTTVLKLDDSLSFNQNNAVGVAQSQIRLPDGTMAQLSGQAFPAASAERKVIKSANNALVIGKEDDAELLEISGKAAEAVCQYVRQLREFALEVMHGNRSNSDKVNTAQSGKAHKALNQALIWLSEKMRVCYGEYGLIRLLKMAIEATKKYKIEISGEVYSNINLKENISLKWPQWYAKDSDDLQKEATAIKTLTDNGVLSRETATIHVSDDYGVKEIKSEQTLIEQDQAKIAALEPQVKETINV